MPELAEDVTAEGMAAQALAAISDYVADHHPFVFDAGAGAGKTETLKRVLVGLLQNSSSTLLAESQRVACITYTKVAAAEIASRIKHDPLVHVSTIHSFAWDAIKSLQPYLRELLPTVPGWRERIEEAGRIDNKPVNYLDSFPRITESDIEIGHNDVLALLTRLLERPKFRRVLVNRFPYIFIDEFQDTNNDLVGAIKKHILDAGGGPLFGFFGDAWQKIYPGVCGQVDHPSLKRVPAQSNFRSVPCIVEALNRLRPDLPQIPSRVNEIGEIVVYHTNDWPGARRKGGHWAGDLEPDAARNALRIALEELTEIGWDLSPENSRRLLLTHLLMGREQGYETITSDLRREDFEDLQDPILSYLHESLETARHAFLEKSFGEMFAALGPRVRHPVSPADKGAWVQEMQEIADICKNSTIGDVLNRIAAGQRVPLSQDIERRMAAFADWDPKAVVKDERLERRMDKHGKTISIPYVEMIALSDYHRHLTGFKTQHGVKGDEFPTVIVALGRGWNRYNPDQFLCWFPDKYPPDKQDSYERMRNLFYVACSRAQGRLALVISQELSDGAFESLTHIFGPNALQPLPYREFPL